MFESVLPDFLTAQMSQNMVGASIPATRIKGGHIFWVAERDKTRPSNKVLSIGTAGSTNPVDVRTIKIASRENGVREYWETRRLESRRWRLVNTDDSTTINVHAQPLILRCSRRLINKRPPQPTMDKCGKVMLPA